MKALARIDLPFLGKLQKYKIELKNLFEYFLYSQANVIQHYGNDFLCSRCLTAVTPNELANSFIKGDIEAIRLVFAPVIYPDNVIIGDNRIQNFLHDLRTNWRTDCLHVAYTMITMANALNSHVLKSSVVTMHFHLEYGLTGGINVRHEKQRERLVDKIEKKQISLRMLRRRMERYTKLLYHIRYHIMVMPEANAKFMKSYEKWLGLKMKWFYQL